MRTRTQRGQSLLLMSLTLLLVTLMICMTLAISSRVRQRLELQNVADAAAYSNAVVTARTFNSISLLNRTIVSHWVAMLGIQANHSWATTAPAEMEAFARAMQEKMDEDACADPLKEAARRSQLARARDAFRHASLSFWRGGHEGDDVRVLGCAWRPGNVCVKRIAAPGLGQLDSEVAAQAFDVWRSVRDLVAIQEAMHRNLQAALGGTPDRQQRLATEIVRMSLGRTGGATFPYRVEAGAPMLDSFGIPDRVPGWREVSNALGTTREALDPLAHAAMGSRGSKFVLSGALQAGVRHYRPEPPRARLYAQRIQKMLNALYGAGRFRLSLKNGLHANYLDQGGNRDDFGDADMDDMWEAIEEADNGPDDDQGVGETMPPNSPEPFYDVNNVRRISPNRSVGWQNATGRDSATVQLAYNSPCGWQGLRLKVSAVTRVFSRATDRVSQHEWMTIARRVERTVTLPDGTIQNEFILKPGYIHGDVRDPHGLERGNHRGNPFFRCHRTHRHFGEQDDTVHLLGPEYNGLGIAPGGFGFVFPQAGPDENGLDRAGASGAFGQPKLPVLLTRAQAGPGMVADPWNLTLRFSFSGGRSTQLDLNRADGDPMAALSTGIAYYHRRCAQHQDPGRGNRNYTPRGGSASCRSWNEPPNMLNPFWRATLVPVDIDERTPRQGDRTPSTRRPRDAPRMLQAASLDDAAQTYRMLVRRGYEGIQ